MRTPTTSARCSSCTTATPNNSLATWSGVYTELIEISDNLFGGTSGRDLVDIEPQNNVDDERLRNFVFERNLLTGTTTAWGGELLMLSGANVTLRDNVFYMPAQSSSIYRILGAQFAQRGSGNLLTVQYNEAYNNTCYAPNSQSAQTCIGFDTMGARSAPSINSFAKNNLFYVPSKATGPAVDNTGSGNTRVEQHRHRHGQRRIHEWQRQLQLDLGLQTHRQLLGCHDCPVWSDALGVPWSPTWNLGAVHQ